jgi:uncharacterized SAM-binding protein YcdF (DUF218 family)
MTTEVDGISSAYRSPRKASLRRKSLLWLIFAGVLVLALLMKFNKSVWLPWLYTVLDVGQSPKEADFVVILAGGTGTRTSTALDLYNQGYTHHLILCGCDDDIERKLRILWRAGVPSDDITVVSSDAESTWEEAQVMLAFLQEQGADSALVITDGFHTRRARATYRRRQSRPGIDLTFVSTTDPFVADSWWETASGPRLIRNEYIKTVYYIFRYGVFPW